MAAGRDTRAVASCLLTCAALACAAPLAPTESPRFDAPTHGIFQPSTPISAGTQDELLASPAPLGGWVAYAARVAGNQDIYARHLTTGLTKRLTEHSTDDTDPAFAPEGRRVAWVSQAEDVKGDIWLLAIDGDGDTGERKRLTDRRTSDGAPCFNARGTALYFASEPVGARHPRIERLDLTTMERHIVVDAGWDPAAAPDDDVLFYTAIDDSQRPRVYAKQLASGHTAALTEGAYAEGFARATRVNGRTVVVFVRFADDTNGDGARDSGDAASLWRVDFNDALFAGAPPARPRPLTSGAHNELFPGPVGSWLVFTASGVTDLDVTALPLSGEIVPGVSEDVILQAARSVASPALRRLALRHLVATSTELVAPARHELARDLAESGRFAEAIVEERTVAAQASDQNLRAIAEVEVERLAMFQDLRGLLSARSDAQRLAVRQRRELFAALVVRHQPFAAAQLRAELAVGEAAYALGERETATRAWERIAADAAAAPDEGARACERLVEAYGAVGDLDAVARVVALMAASYGVERRSLERAVRAWLARVAAQDTQSPLAAFESIARAYTTTPLIASQALAAQARLLAQTGMSKVAVDAWQEIAEQHRDERTVRAEALLALGGLAAPEVALDAYERLLREFPEDPELRAHARRGLATIALRDAGALELEAMAASDPQSRADLQRRALIIYSRVAAHNRAEVEPHRRAIALAAGLHELDGVRRWYEGLAAASPQDKVARYAYGYALSHGSPPDLDGAEREILAALDLDPRFPAAHLTMGWIREQRERRAHGRGWLEKAVDSYDTTIDLLPAPDAKGVTPESHLWAAAQLNKGNALLALGKLDGAFKAYLARATSGVPFLDRVAEALYCESFARVAMAQEAFDVALDFAVKAMGLTNRRHAALSALMGAVYLQVAIAEPRRAAALEAFAEAQLWFDAARERYETDGDWARVIPMLRGIAYAQEAIGDYEPALQTTRRILELLRRGAGPTNPQPEGVAGIVKESPVEPHDVTRAKVGFSGEQEETIALDQSARQLDRFGDAATARSFHERRLDLVRSEADDAVQGPRIEIELVATLHATARAAALVGDTSRATQLWEEALQRSMGHARSEGLTKQQVLRRWQRVLVLLESLAHLVVRQPGWMRPEVLDLAREAATQGLEVVAPDSSDVAHRFARWLSLSHLHTAMQVPQVAPKRTIAASIAALDHAVRDTELAADYATLASDPALRAHIDSVAGEPTAAVPEPADWRAAFDRSLWAGPVWLERAITFFETASEPQNAPERSAFVLQAADYLLARDASERAWRLLERERLLQLRPNAERLPEDIRWDLGQLALSREGNGSDVQTVEPLYRALSGWPASIGAIGAALEGNATLLQAFDAGFDRLHWFATAGTTWAHRSSSRDRASIAAAIKQLLTALPLQTLYVDTGEILRGGPWELPLPAGVEVAEVLSATYLVAAHQRRSLARGAVLAWRAEPARAAVLTLLESPIDVSARAATAGKAQVQWALGDGSRVDLDAIVRNTSQAQFAVVREADSARARRAVVQAFLIAGVPTVVALPPPPVELPAMWTQQVDVNRSTQLVAPFAVHVQGYRGMTSDDRVRFALETGRRMAEQAKAVFTEADKAQTRLAWDAADRYFAKLLDVVAFLIEPQSAAVATQHDAAFMGQIEGRAILFRVLHARVQKALGNFDAAANLQQQILAAQKNAPPKTRAQLYAELGQTYAAAERHADAAQAFRDCAALCDGDRALWEQGAGCLSRLGSMQRTLFDAPGAEAAYLAAIERYSALGSLQEVTTRRFLGFLYESALSDYDRAEATFRAAVAAADALLSTNVDAAAREKMQRTVSLLHIDLARVLRSRGAYQEALTEVGHAVAILPESALAERSEADLEGARVHWYRGNYMQALALQRRSMDRALRAMQEPGSRKTAEYLEIQARSLAGLITLNRGDLEVAEQEMLEALRLAEATNRPSEQAAQLNNLGRILLAAGRIEAAIARYRAALAIDESLGSKEGRAYSLRGLAVALHRQGNHADALRTIDEALALSRTIKNSYNELLCVQARGDIQVALGDADAEATYRAAELLAAKTGVEEVRWQAQYALARAAERRGNIAEARRLLAGALDVAERLGRGRSDGQEQYGRDALYEDVLRLAIVEQDVTSALEIMERFRARFLLDVLGGGSVSLPSDAARERIDAEARAREAVAAAERLASMAHQDGAAAVGRAQAQHAEAVRALRTSYPRLARAFTIAPVSLAEAQRRVRPGEVWLAYITGRESLSIVAITASQARAVSVVMPRVELERLVAELQQQLQGFANVTHALERLSALLLEPVAPELDAATEVIIVPDGALYRVPWAALPWRSDTLLAARAVAMAPSVSVLVDRLMEPRPRRPTSIVALAPASDLPFAALEVAALAQADAVLGAEATEARLRGVVADALDVAGHTELSAQDPLESALVLAQGASDDGRLMVREVFGLTNAPAWVSLSGCDTVGSGGRGAEWASLAHAFLAAGASTVIASQTRVSDLAAAVMMKRFYREVQNASAAAALRASALHVRRYFAHPAHWATFVVLGDPR